MRLHIQIVLVVDVKSDVVTVALRVLLHLHFARVRALRAARFHFVHVAVLRASGGGALAVASDHIVGRLLGGAQLLAVAVCDLRLIVERLQLRGAGGHRLGAELHAALIGNVETLAAKGGMRTAIDIDTVE